MGKTWSSGRIIIDFPPGHTQHGLEVVMRRQRIGEVLDSLADRPKTDAELAAMTPDEIAIWGTERSERNIAEFAELVIGWNFDPWELGEPIEISSRSVKLLDQNTYDAIQDAYTEATRRVAPPLPEPSDGGEPSEAALMLPQEPLSDSP